MTIKSVFVDTDVIIDFLIDRRPFSSDSAKLFTYAEREMLEINVSSLCFNNIYYIIRRLESDRKARELLIRLDNLTKILTVSENTIKQALISDFKDFEDSIQNNCAKEAGLKTIITRNIKDYSKSELAIHTPHSYLNIFVKMIKKEN